MTKLIISGGGSKEKPTDFHSLILERMPPKKKLLYLPLAMPEKKYLEGLEWCRQAFPQMKPEMIELWTTVQGKTLRDLEEFGAVYMGRGNTFKLLYEFKQAGFDRTLKEYALKGLGVIYGGSAGAVILGKDIMTAAGFDKNRVGLKDTLGLDLVQGHSLWCHYQEKHNPMIREYLQDYGYPVIAMQNGSGIIVEGKKIQAVGAKISLFKIFKKSFTQKELSLGATLTI